MIDTPVNPRRLAASRARRASTASQASLPKAATCFILVTALLAHPALAAEPTPEPLPPGLELAIDRGLVFLQKQQKTTGSFDATGPANAMTGLAIMAFLASGHTPDSGKFGVTVRNAVEYLLKQNPKDGYYGHDGGRMYGHCIVTIALAEVHGLETDLTQRTQVRTALENALKVICTAQDIAKSPDSAGGWRYEPASPDSDLSLSGWGMLSLKACRDAGLSVPQERLDRAVNYALRCYRADQKGFAYTPRDRASASMTGTALLNLHLLGATDRQELTAAARFLTDKPVAGDTPYWYYAMYHVTHGAHQAGNPAWSAAWKHAWQQLLPAQRKDDGSWPPRKDEPGGDGKPGRFYSTTMAVMTLSAPLRLLPVHQR